jgi:hypothetical protein
MAQRPGRMDHPARAVIVPSKEGHFGVAENTGRSTLCLYHNNERDRDAARGGADDHARFTGTDHQHAL